MNNYVASIKDLRTIEEGIKKVYDQRLSFIFEDKKILLSIIICLFDDFYLYIWTTKKIKNLNNIPCNLSKYYAYKIKHNIILQKDFKKGWAASLRPRELNNVLPKELKSEKVLKISGCTFRDFLNIQKGINFPKNYPYTTYESYLATIIHEFGHAYYNAFKKTWYSDKKTNLELLTSSLKLYLKKSKQTKHNIPIPHPVNLSEIFAFCTEYFASVLFFKQHKKLIDKYNTEWIKKLLIKEKKNNLNKKDSVIEIGKIDNAHATAAVIGKLIIENKSISSWPRKLLQDLYI